MTRFLTSRYVPEQTTVPADLRDPGLSVDVFKSRLKTFLFSLYLPMVLQIDVISFYFLNFNFNLYCPSFPFVRYMFDAVLV